MDREKLLELEIEETDLEEIEDALEEKQNDLESRMDTAESNGNLERKQELEKELQKVFELMQQVRDEKETAKTETEETVVVKHGAVPVVSEESKEHTVPTVINEGEERVENVKKSIKEALGIKKDEQVQETKASKEQEAQEKKHEKDLKAKAAEIRKKAAKEERARSEAVTEPETDTEQNQTNHESKDEYTIAFERGIKEYADKKYDDALKDLLKVGNAGEKSGLSKDKIGQAEQLIARMYQKGQGTTQDESRAIFWFEKAVGHKNVEGCLALGQLYADLTPKSPKAEKENVEKILKYFGLAGNYGSKAAKEKYVEVCINKKRHISNANIRQALKFLDDLIALEEDAYIKQLLVKKKKEVKQLKKSDTKDKTITKTITRRSQSKIPALMEDILTVIGSVCFACGVILMCHYLLFDLDTFFNFNRFIPAYFMNHIPPIASNEIITDVLSWLRLGRTTGYTGLEPAYWAIIFLPLGQFLIGLTYVQERGKLANVVCEITLYFSAVTAFMTYYRLALEYKQNYISSDFIPLYVISGLLAYIFVSKLLAMIPRRILRK